MFFVNTSQDISSLLLLDPSLSLPLLLRYSQDSVSTLKQHFPDMNDSLSRGEDLFIPKEYSLFMLEALPKSKLTTMRPRPSLTPASQRWRASPRSPEPCRAIALLLSPHRALQSIWSSLLQISSVSHRRLYRFCFYLCFSLSLTPCRPQAYLIDSSLQGPFFSSLHHLASSSALGLESSGAPQLYLRCGIVAIFYHFFHCVVHHSTPTCGREAVQSLSLSAVSFLHQNLSLELSSQLLSKESATLFPLTQSDPTVIVDLYLLILQVLSSFPRPLPLLSSPSAL
jgi:hypothetical protein